MTDRPLTPYERLGVSPRASASEITTAYRRLLRRHHPDSRTPPTAFNDDDAVAGEDAAAALGPIIEAYAQLHDPARRAEYDRGQQAPKPPTTTFRAGRDRGFLLRATPVSWEQQPPSSHGLRRPIVTEQAPMTLWLQFLRDRWLY